MPPADCTGSQLVTRLAGWPRPGPARCYAARMPPLRTAAVIRYVTPLREGGSLPAVVEADDLGTYVLKFRGAGQGEKVLAAEVIAGGLAQALGLAVPERVLLTL